MLEDVPVQSLGRSQSGTRKRGRAARRLVILHAIRCRVGKAHIPEFDAAADHLLILLLRVHVIQVRHKIHDLGNTLEGCHGAGRSQDHHGKHHEAHQDLGHIGDKCRKISDLHAAGNDAVAAEPDHSHGREIHKEGHDRHGQDDRVHRIESPLLQIIVQSRELLLLMILSHEGLHHAHIGKRFLNAVV